MPALSRSQVIPANEYRRERWRNGDGWTREIARDGGDAWTWRLSIAEIERESAFSMFAGVEREQVLLAGNGLRLSFDDGDTAELLPPHGRCRYAGERGLRGEPVDGPVHAFNLMWRCGAVDAQLWHRPLVGPMVVFAEPHAIWAVHLIAGQARFADDSGVSDLAAGDTAILVAGDTRLRHVLDGGGEALLIKIVPRRARPDSSGRG